MNKTVLIPISKLLTAAILLSIGMMLICHRNMNYDYECREFQNRNIEVFTYPNESRPNTIADGLNLIDSSYFVQNRNLPFDSLVYLRVGIQAVKGMFYHGNAAFDWKENWIAYLLGRYSWSHFNSIVDPNLVIRHCSAMCSQQTMVFTHLMHQRGYKYRYVYITNAPYQTGHFACEIFAYKKWHFVDVNGEPDWSRIKGKSNQSMTELLEKNRLKSIYDSSFQPLKEVIYTSTNVAYSTTNAAVGKNMILFQAVTKELSWILPLVLGVCLALDFTRYHLRRK